MPRAPGVTQVFAIVAVLQALVLSRAEGASGAIVALAVLVLAQILRSLAAARAPDLARGYPCRRLLSMRYLVPALGLPLGSAALFARAGWVGAASVVLVHLGLARSYRARLTRPGALRIALLPAALGGFFLALESLALSGHEWRLGGRLLYAEESRRQRVTLVERAGSLDLFIDGELQFRTADERLYHEGLVAPALASSVRPWSVLVMGGGDGLVARDLLRCARVDHVTIVDWDPLVTRLFRREAALTALNEGALVDPRVEILHRDVRDLLAESGKPFDVVIGDLTDPDPLAEGSGLLTPGFFAAVRGRLAPGGIVVTHASSPAGVGAPKAVHDALVATGFMVRAYARTVPSFGSVGYLIGSLAGGPAIELPSWAKPLSFDA